MNRRRRLGLTRALVSLLIIAVVLATIFFLVLRNGSQISIVENAIGSFFSPVQNALSGAAENVKTFLTNQRNYGKLQSRYEALEQENLQLSLELQGAEEAIRENDRLQNLLDAKSSYSALDPIYARVIARDAGQWFSTFSINRGTSSGVSVGMAVVNKDGLIGRVYEAGLNYANVLSIIDPRSGLGCLIQRTRDNGILRGGVSDSDDTAQCYVNYLPNVNNIVPGDVVVTSGTDALYPKGLTVGTVTQISLSAGSDGNYAVVAPAVDFLHLEEVLVLRDVVETASDGNHAPMLTPTPAPTASPTPPGLAEPTLAPQGLDEIYTYPQAGATATPAPNAVLETLPEDEWAEN